MNSHAGQASAEHLVISLLKPVRRKLFCFEFQDHLEKTLLSMRKTSAFECVFDGVHSMQNQC